MRSQLFPRSLLRNTMVLSKYHNMVRKLIIMSFDEESEHITQSLNFLNLLAWVMRITVVCSFRNRPCGPSRWSATWSSVLASNALKTSSNITMWFRANTARANDCIYVSQYDFTPIIVHSPRVDVDLRIKLSLCYRSGFDRHKVEGSSPPEVRMPR